MSRFLVWNVNNNPSTDGLVQNLVRQIQIDVVLLVEYAVGKSRLGSLLQSDGLFRRPSAKGFGVFARADHRLDRYRYQTGKGIGMWKLIPPSGQEGLLVLVHGPERRNNDESTQRVFFRGVAEAVGRCEKQQNHRRSLIAGDFNVQPFESPIVDADGLHAIGAHQIQNRTIRQVRRSGATTEFFYNPTWRLYGHEQHPEAGAASYYWINNWARELAWFMLDQVVIRPGEIDRFPEAQLNIVTTVGSISLLDSHGRPDSKAASDHLPLTFQWDL